MLDSDGKYNILCWVRAGPWHKRNRQMLGVLPIPRGAKKIFIIIIIYYIFLLPILLQYYELKILQKSDSAIEKNISIVTFYVKLTLNMQVSQFNS